jgi:FkbM family methyltransferase
MLAIKEIIRRVLPAPIFKKLAYFNVLFQMRGFKKKYPNCTLFYNLYTNERNKYYSQHNQDWLISENFFKDRKDGFFCDVGGNHPLYINNTRYFEELGWAGAVFEPLPYMQKLWKQHRKAKFFPYAASDSEGEVSFAIVKDVSGWEDMLSYVKETSKVNYDYKTKDIFVKTRPLKDVFKEENMTLIDYMSIDVEGHEIQVLKGIDFNEVKINVLTIENNFGGSSGDSQYGDDEIRRIMFENGYILWGRIVNLDDIYVRNDFIKSLEADKA